MRLTRAEFKLLDGLNNIQGGALLVRDLNKKTLVTAAWMAGKGLLRAREWDKGRVVETALGRNSYVSNRPAFPSDQRGTQ